MKIDPSKRYVTRNGGTVGPFVPNQGANRAGMPWVPVYDQRPGNAYTEDGRYYVEDKAHGLDLIAVIVPPAPPPPPPLPVRVVGNMKDPYGGVVVRLTSAAEPHARYFADLLNAMSGEIHKANSRFYQNIDTGAPIDRNPGEMLALIHSEVSEMLEGVRKGLPDSHLPDRSTEEVEAADVLIRLMDYCCFRRLDLGGATLAKLAYNATRADHSLEARRAPGGKKF